MKLIDVSVPIDSNLATYPGNTPFSLVSNQTPSQGRQLERFHAFTRVLTPALMSMLPAIFSMTAAVSRACRSKCCAVGHGSSN